MNLTVIAAVSEDNVIGIEGRLPWSIPEDMKRFKELTTHHPVIMGRRTYESIPKTFRPLPNRKNIVLSRNFSKSESGIYVARDINEAIALTEEDDSFVIGGEMVYNVFLPLVNRMELTLVREVYERGDAHFPHINFKEWGLVSRDDGETKDGLGYSFLTYERR